MSKESPMRLESFIGKATLAVDAAGRDLSPDSYTVRTQSDGSWLVRLSAASTRGQGVRFEARSADGTADPRGCVFNSAKG